MQMTDISILGCGWLGLPLARKLLENGYSVKGSTTSENKIELLKNSGIEPYLISVSPDQIDGNIKDFLSKILIIDIPPKLKEGNFTKKIERLIPYIEQSAVENVLFISSISIYDNIGFVTEETLPNPKTENGRQLVESEKKLACNPNFKSTIVRLGGLIGPERHPAKHLAGKQNLTNPDAPINLIHLDDCIGIIEAIIGQNRWGETFNAVAPFHPKREDFYTEKANELGLQPPMFDHSSESAGKLVCSEKIMATLGYVFSDKLGR